MYILCYLFFFILVQHLISNKDLNLHVQGVGEEMRELDVRVKGVSKELRETDVCVGSMGDRLKEMEGRVVVVESRNGVAEECEELRRKVARLEDMVKRESERREESERVCRRLERPVMDMERKFGRMERKDREEREEKANLERDMECKRKKVEDMEEMCEMMRARGGGRGDGAGKRHKRE